MIRVALGQLNATVGDLEGNLARMTAMAAEATAAGADLVAFPELAITGYPPEDLVLRPAFVRDNLAALEALATATSSGCDVLVGFVDRTGRGLHNAAALVRGGEVVARYAKCKLPNYGVFDEQRYFQPGADPLRISLKSLDIAVTICFDIWNIEWLGDLIGAIGPVQVILNISASPFHTGKIEAREQTIGRCAREFGCAIAYCNLVGGQDELVFDGRSALFGKDGKIILEARAFEEDLLIFDLAAEKISQKMEPPRAKARGSLGGILSPDLSYRGECIRR